MLWIPYATLSIADGTQMINSLLLLLVTLLPEAAAVCELIGNKTKQQQQKSADDHNSLSTVRADHIADCFLRS